MRTDENRKSKRRGEQEREREAQQSERDSRDSAAQSGSAAQVMAAHLPLGRFLHQYRRVSVMASESDKKPSAPTPPQKNARFALALEKPTDPTRTDGPPAGGRLIGVWHFPDGSQDALRFGPKDEKNNAEAVKQKMELPGEVLRPDTGTPFEEKKIVPVDGEQISEGAAYARQSTRQNFRPDEYNETTFVRGLFHAVMDQDAPSVETLMPESAEAARQKQERDEEAIRRAADEKSLRRTKYRANTWD